MLGQLGRSSDPNLLVGFDHADDAGVYRLAPDLALVQTVDFFTPVVDDPEIFGAIAAANALSDIYAMGARPLTALGIVAFPADAPAELLRRIVLGGRRQLEAAGCLLLGGHSVRDDELKFGYAVTGTAHPDKIWTNAGARVGDVLLLTKALGTGVIATALKRGRAEEGHVAAAVASMRALNRDAAEVLAAASPHAVTDITGFGLLGHAREMARASGVRVSLSAAALPLLPGALGYAAEYRPQGLRDNREFVSPAVEFAAPLEENLSALLYDPQTSGGLLVALAADAAAGVLAQLREVAPATARVGQVLPARENGTPLRVVE